MPQFEAQVIQIIVGQGMNEQFVDDRLEVGQGTDRRKGGRSAGRIRRRSEASNRADSTTAVGRRGHANDEPAVGPEGWPQRRVRQIDVEHEHSGHISAGSDSGAGRSHFFLRRAAVSCSLSRTPIAVAFDDGHVGMMQQAIQQRDDAGGVGKDFVPFFEWSIGRQDHRLAFVTPVDDFVEQVGGLVVEGKIADLVDAEQSDIGVAAQLAAAAFRRLAVQFFQQRGGGAEQHGVPGQHRGVADVLSDHRLAQTVAADQDQVAGFAQESPASARVR